MAACAAALALLSASAGTASAQLPLPPPPAIPPPGANDFSCKPPPNHPYPVVMLHGTSGAQGSFLVLSPHLKRLGYCPFSLDYGNQAVGPIERSAEQVSAFIDRVLAATAADKVAIVGHSQGGIIPRYIVKFLGGESKIAEVVGIAPSSRGTTTPLADLLGITCPACLQQKASSEFIRTLNAGDPTPGPIDYTQIATRYDWQVVPHHLSFLPDEGDGRVTNVRVQDRCPLDVFEHITLVVDPVALQYTLNALGRDGPGHPGFRPDCLGLGLLRFPGSDSTASASPQP